MSINVAPGDMSKEPSRDSQAKEAGQTLYQAIQSSHNSSNGLLNSGTMHPELLSTDTIEGMEEGKMSAVRRTFCLFTAFDFILTSILWIIYTQLIGETPVWKAFTDQVSKYTFELSLFDTVLVSAFRFIVLILGYALFRLNHWWPVAVTTLVTCVFLLIKCFLFKFQDESGGRGNPMSYVLLIIPFVIAWMETWFVDFKVLPQEKKARETLRFVSERTPLIRDGRGGYTNSEQQINEEIEYYSPQNTPDGSEDEREKNDDRFHSAPTSRGHSRSASRSSTVSLVAEREYLNQAHEAWDMLWELLHKDDWKLEAGKDAVKGCVKCRHEKGVGKMFMLQAYIDWNAEKLWKDLIHGIDESPTWNPTLLDSKTLQVVDDCTVISYNISAEAAGGIISSRDFVSVRHWGVREGIFLSAGVSTTHVDMPAQKNYVRGENGAGGWAFKPVPESPEKKCEFIWISRTELKGWLPQSVIDKAMSSFLLDFLKYVRKHVEDLKSGGHV